MKKNCWEIKNCGREPGGSNSVELGICPACTDKSFDGLNSGKNGGRVCWAVVGTLCGGEVQGTFAEKQTTCLNCEIFKNIRIQEGREFTMVKPSKTVGT